MAKKSWLIWQRNKTIRRTDWNTKRSLFFIPCWFERLFSAFGIRCAFGTAFAAGYKSFSLSKFKSFQPQNWCVVSDMSFVTKTFSRDYFNAMNNESSSWKATMRHATCLVIWKLIKWKFVVGNKAGAHVWVINYDSFCIRFFDPQNKEKWWFSIHLNGKNVDKFNPISRIFFDNPMKYISWFTGSFRNHFPKKKTRISFLFTATKWQTEKLIYKNISNEIFSSYFPESADVYLTVEKISYNHRPQNSLEKSI